MPELPEVETVRRDLQRALRGKRISAVEVSLPKIVRGSAGTFRRKLTGRRVATLSRRGKLLIISFDDPGLFLLIHLKMTGQLIYRDRKQLVAGGHSWPSLRPGGLRGAGPPTKLDKHTHVMFHFGRSATLYFNDLRQFGYVALVDEAGRREVEAAFGVEPLSRLFTVDYLAAALRGRKTALKNVLLNQTKIAGLGNIYVDEACFFAGVRPTRRADRLTRADITKLYRGIQHVLTQSLKARGTTFNDYRDGHGRQGNFVSKLKVYGRAGQRCRRCKRGTIAKVKVNGRGTVYCPSCQK